MERRNFLHLSSLLGLLGFSGFSKAGAASVTGAGKAKAFADDRKYWVELLHKIASPLLENLSKGELRKNMEVAYSPTWDGREKQVAYLEAFGRLLSGIAPWFNLPEEDTYEGKIRKQLQEQALLSIKNSVDPDSPDYMLWYNDKTAQPIVDAAFVAHALLRAPKALWEPLDDITKFNVIKEFKNFRAQQAGNNNWLLFSAIIESFLLAIGETDIHFDKIDEGIDTFSKKWYVGDGWYSDGPHFAFDHYNAYVIHSMLVDSLKTCVAKGRRSEEELQTAYKRMQRYAHFTERYISPEGYYLVIGRSSTYRTALFQPLVQLALEDKLPEDVTPAQVRCGITAVLKHVFIPSTFTEKGWLTLGLVGNKQSNIADSYSNTGSMYLCSLVFLALGLPAEHTFWSDPFTAWTQLKAWNGEVFPKDYRVNY
ncbi:MAG: DUF2264 domain-containing protein [Chitinophagaceae bacterium]|jgi:hypothetical protein|nr:DUF2264 domain-containing protein [Chitinophagaceae bacterium]